MEGILTPHNQPTVYLLSYQKSGFFEPMPICIHNWSYTNVILPEYFHSDWLKWCKEVHLNYSSPKEPKLGHSDAVKVVIIDAMAQASKMSSVQGYKR